MSAVFTALATSVDGYITGPDPSPDQALGRGGSPESLLVTCGGFARAPAGQWYFVAHCENSLWVRQKAGMKVSAPPPGIAPGFRTGECLPFQPPAGSSR